MLPEDSSFALSAAVCIVCDLRREEIIVEDINTQRAKLRTALQRHYYSYGQLISACEHAENSGKRAELGRLLSRVTEELAPHERDITRFVREHTAEPTEIPGIAKFKEGLECIGRFVRGFDVSEVRVGLLLLAAARGQLGALIEEMTYVDGSNGQGGSAGAGMRSPLPKPPGGLVAGAKKSQPRTDQVEPGFRE